MQHFKCVDGICKYLKTYIKCIKSWKIYRLQLGDTLFRAADLSAKGQWKLTEPK